MANQQPKLNLADVTLLVVGFVIGMGIFRTPVNVAKTSPDWYIFFGAWIAGSVIALCGALTYAEIGSRYPVTGGYYKIFSYAYHPSVAFAVNCIILISNAASVAGVALIGAEYISAVLFSGSKDIRSIQILIAILCIAIFYAINLAGLKMSARTQNFLMLLKIAMVLMLILPLFMTGSAPQTATAATTVKPALMEYIKAFGLGLVAVSFANGGYQQTINFGEEVERPSRNIPRAIFIGMLIIAVLYIAINIAYVKIIGFDNLKSAENISAIMATHVFGPAGAKIISVLLFFSVLAYVNGQLMSNPRVMEAMSTEGMLPASFAKRTQQQNVLLISLTVFAILSVLVVFWAETFDRILSFTIFLDSIGMVLSAATIFKLRKETPQLDGTGIYKMKLYPLLPLLFMAAYIFVAISIFLDKPATAMLGMGILAVFMAVYFVVQFVKSPNSSRNSDR